MPLEILAHEACHSIQHEQQFGPEAWWDQYLADKRFRFEQELQAHRIEYQDVLFREARARCVGCSLHPYRSGSRAPLRQDDNESQSKGDDPWLMQDGEGITPYFTLVLLMTLAASVAHVGWCSTILGARSERLTTNDCGNKVHRMLAKFCKARST
jgi:hypothetical protein